MPNGHLILHDVVSRIFPNDECENQPLSAFVQRLHQVMQEALNVHFQGLAFRERNAGRQIDAHMTDRGFNNQIGIHPETGKSINTENILYLRYIRLNQKVFCVKSYLSVSCFIPLQYNSLFLDFLKRTKTHRLSLSFKTLYNRKKYVIY